MVTKERKKCVAFMDVEKTWQDRLGNSVECVKKYAEYMESYAILQIGVKIFHGNSNAY